MVFNNALIEIFFYIKIASVLAAIPLAIIGFKKNNKILAVLSLVLLFLAYGFAEMNKAKIKRKAMQVVATTPESADSSSSVNNVKNQAEIGKVIYIQVCQVCHGPGGDANISGAANLKRTILSADEKFQIIKNGKGAMPGFSNLSDEDIIAVTNYVATFSQK